MARNKRSRRKEKVQIPIFLKKSFLILFVFFCLTFLYIWLNIAITRKRYELAELEEKRKAADNMNKELNFRVNRLMSLDYVESMAKNKLKLREPEKKDIKWIRK